MYKVGRVYKEIIECLNDGVTQTKSLWEKRLTFTSGEEVLSMPSILTNGILKQWLVYVYNVLDCFTSHWWSK